MSERDQLVEVVKAKEARIAELESENRELWAIADMVAEALRQRLGPITKRVQ